MRIYNDTEIRITTDDLRAAICLWINKHMNRNYSDDQLRVDEISLHPGNKYVLRAVINEAYKAKPQPPSSPTGAE